MLVFSRSTQGKRRFYLSLEEEFHDMWMYLEEEQEIWALDEKPVLTPEISKEIDLVHNAMCGTAA